MKTTIYLVRHAEAEGNIAKTFQGHSDLPVTEKGHRQLACLAERFATVPLEAIYTSPLLRTRETAAAVNLHHGLPLQLDPALIEINGGDLEGLHWCDIPPKYPEQDYAWQNQPHLFCAPNGESMAAVFSRISTAIDRIAAENQGKTISIVTHGGAIRNYLCYAQGWQHARLREVMWDENTAVSLIEYDEAGKPNIVYMSDASHLTPELSTLVHQDWWKKTITEDTTE